MPFFVVTPDPQQVHCPRSEGHSCVTPRNHRRFLRWIQALSPWAGVRYGVEGRGDNVAVRLSLGVGWSTEDSPVRVFSQGARRQLPVTTPSGGGGPCAAAGGALDRRQACWTRRERAWRDALR